VIGPPALQARRTIPTVRSIRPVTPPLFATSHEPYEPLRRVRHASDAFRYASRPSDASRAALRPIVPIRPAVPSLWVPLGTFRTPLRHARRTRATV
jgi:hypothetical protein